MGAESAAATRVHYRGGPRSRSVAAMDGAVGKTPAPPRAIHQGWIERDAVGQVERAAKRSSTFAGR